MCDAPWQQFVGLDVNHSIQELCQRHAPAEVLERVKDWVAYMERAMALNDWRPAQSDGPSDA